MILVLGDIHGNFNYLKNQIIQKRISDCTIIQVGDFGIGFTHRDNDIATLESLNDFLIGHSITMLSIRGNHDDPSFFDGSVNYSNLKLIKDYTSLEIEGNGYLFIGGAISVDRTERIKES